jgi:hypothetical protein
VLLLVGTVEAGAFTTGFICDNDEETVFVISDGMLSGNAELNPAELAGGTVDLTVAILLVALALEIGIGNLLDCSSDAGIARGWSLIPLAISSASRSNSSKIEFPVALFRVDAVAEESEIPI